MMKKTFGLVAAAVLTVALGACGDDGDSGGGGTDEAAYCDAFESARSKFDDTDFTQLDSQTFDDVKQEFSDVRDQAPEEIQGEWETLEGALDEFEQILSDAGLSLDDLTSIQNGEIPDNFDMSKLQDLQENMSAFAENNEFQQAADAIQKDAETRCDIPTEGGES